MSLAISFETAPGLNVKLAFLFRFVDLFPLGSSILFAGNENLGGYRSYRAYYITLWLRVPFFPLSRLSERFSPSHKTWPGTENRVQFHNSIRPGLAELYDSSKKLSVGICRLGAALPHSIS